MTEEVKSESDKKKEDWMNSKWRPMMGWMYMLVCTMDMVIFPILWSLLQTMTHSPITQWNPLTLQGAGLFHIAMGAVLGIAAFGRTQEKLGGANNGGIQTPATGFQSGAPAFGQPSAGGFGSSSPGFGAVPPATGFGSQPLGGGVGSSSGFGGPAATPPSWGTTPVSTPAFTAPAQMSSEVQVGIGGKPAPTQPERPPI
jgi:hypothetical protein